MHFPHVQRSLSLLLVTLGITGSLFVVPSPASAATAPPVFATRYEYADPTLAAWSFAAVAGVDGGTVSVASTTDGLVGITGSHPLADQPRSGMVLLPRNLAAGTYQTPSAGGSFVLPGMTNSCMGGTSTLVVHDAVWQNGRPTRLSLSGSVDCQNGQPRRAWTEVRLGEPAGTQLVGQLRADRVDTPTTRIGTPIDVPVPFVNEGSGPVTPGGAVVTYNDDADWPAYSVKSDGCRGRTLQPQQACQVVVHYGPQWYATFQAVLGVVDGRGAAAEGRLWGQATRLPDQPEGTTASGLDRTVVVDWWAPSLSTTNGSYDHFDVIRTNPGGSVTTVGSVQWQVGRTAYEFMDDAVSDGPEYSYAVRVYLPGGTAGPVSRVAHAHTVGRLLLYLGGVQTSSRMGPNQVAIDPYGRPVARSTELPDARSHAISPDASLWAVESRAWTGNGDACSVSIAPRRSTAKFTPVTVAPRQGDAVVCDADPTFTSNHSIVVSHIDDTRVASAVPRLVSVDLDTAVATDVANSDGLTDPAAAPDGSLVTVDAAAHALVRLDRDGTRVQIPGTNGASEPAVSPTTGDIAFVRTVGYDSYLTVVDAAGGNARTLSTDYGPVSGPSWTADGGYVYWSQYKQGYGTNVWRARPDVSDRQQVTWTSTGERSPLVIDLANFTGSRGSPTIDSVDNPAQLAGQPVTLRGHGRPGARVTMLAADVLNPAMPRAVGEKVVGVDGTWALTTSLTYNTALHVESIDGSSAVTNVGVRVKVTIDSVRYQYKDARGRCVVRFNGGTYPYIPGASVYIRTSTGTPIGFTKVTQYGASGRYSALFGLTCGTTYKLFPLITGRAADGNTYTLNGTGTTVSVTTPR